MVQRGSAGGAEQEESQRVPEVTAAWFCELVTAGELKMHVGVA